jgi:hypothetical protein
MPSAANLEAKVVVERLDLESILKAHENRRRGRQERRTGLVFTDDGRLGRHRRQLRDTADLLILTGDFFFELLQPRLEEANFGGRVVGPCRAGLEGHKSDQRPSRESLFLVS